MDDYEFVADLVGSIMWPALALAVMLLLRKPVGELVRELLPYIKSVRFKDVEVALNRDIAEAESKSPDIGQGGEGWELDHDMLSRIDISPRSAILESWLAVERELIEAALASGLSVDLRRRGLSLTVMREMEERGIISADLAAMIRDLRSVRHRAVHDLEVDFYPDAARRYARLASLITSRLRTGEHETPDG